jgi:hypothetical protein
MESKDGVLRIPNECTATYNGYWVGDCPRTDAPPHLAHEAFIRLNHRTQSSVRSLPLQSRHQPTVIICPAKATCTPSSSRPEPERVRLVTGRFKGVNRYHRYGTTFAPTTHNGFCHLLWCSSMAGFLWLGPNRTQLDHAWGAIETKVTARHKDIPDRVGIVIIEVFKDLWGIYVGKSTHR